MEEADYSDTTVVIPVKDEPSVGMVAAQVLKELPGCKVLIVYKNSDGKKPKIRKEVEERVTLLEQKGTGKGVACVQAASHVKTPIMCFIDGDMTYDAKDLKKLVELVRKGAKMAIGNRLVNLNRKAMSGTIEFGNKMLTIAGNVIYGLSLRDSQTGLRAIRKEAFDQMELKETHFGIETEMNIKARKLDMLVEEVPIHYYERVGESKQPFKLVNGVRLFLVNFKFLSD
jgi:glycosyltransferase involved in cell wall biosynthesis